MTLARNLTILLAAVAVVFPARAQDIPPLTPEQSAAIALGVDPTGAASDPGFDALVANITSWGDLMRIWASATSARPSESVRVAWLESLVDAPESEPIGADAVLLGRLIERAPARQRALVDRWVIEPLDSISSPPTASRAIVLYVVRPASAIIDEPEPGWFIRAAARYAGVAEIPAQNAAPNDPPRRYPVFVGATYEVTSRAGMAPSAIFAWIGLGVALLLGVFITLALIINQARHRGTSVLRNRATLSDRQSSS